MNTFTYRKEIVGLIKAECSLDLAISIMELDLETNDNDKLEIEILTEDITRLKIAQSLIEETIKHTRKAE